MPVYPCPLKRAGPGPTLAVGDRLLMLLVYYRTHVSHKFLGFLFGLHDGNVGRNMNLLGPLLVGVFRIPERRADLGPDEVAELFFDATEQPCNRPGRGHRRPITRARRGCIPSSTRACYEL